MKHSIRHLSFFAIAVAIGATAFGLLWLPKAQAAYCNPSGNATMCYKGSTVQNVPPFIQAQYLANGGSCGACATSGN